MTRGPMGMVSSEGLGVMVRFSVCGLWFAIDATESVGRGLFHLRDLELDFEEFFAGAEFGLFDDGADEDDRSADEEDQAEGGESGGGLGVKGVGLHESDLHQDREDPDQSGI